MVSWQWHLPVAGSSVAQGPLHTGPVKSKRKRFLHQPAVIIGMNKIDIQRVRYRFSHALVTINSSLDAIARDAVLHIVAGPRT